MPLEIVFLEPQNWRPLKPLSKTPITAFTVFRAGRKTSKNFQKVSKIFSTFFNSFRAAPVFRPLLGGSEKSSLNIKFLGGMSRGRPGGYPGGRPGPKIFTPSLGPRKYRAYSSVSGKGVVLIRACLPNMWFSGFRGSSKYWNLWYQKGFLFQIFISLFSGAFRGFKLQA